MVPTRNAPPRCARSSGASCGTSDGDLLPFNTDGLPNAGGPDAGLFLAGDVPRERTGRADCAPQRCSCGKHNRLADKIARKFSDADDEQIYQLARKIVRRPRCRSSPTMNSCRRCLDRMRRRSRSTTAGTPNVDPSIANEFSTALFRVGHSMLSSELVLADRHGPFGSLPLRNAFFNPEFLAADPESIDFLLTGFTRQRSQEIDVFLVEDVRNFLFGPPGAGGRGPGVARTFSGAAIMGCRRTNAVRVAYGLDPVGDFNEISADVDVVDRLASVYISTDETRRLARRTGGGALAGRQRRRADRSGV